MIKHMTPRQKSDYLANILSISKDSADMQMTESLVLQDIMRSIDASWHDLQAAERLAASGSYTLRLMREPALKKANIEDMITLALADGKLTDEETNPIEKLSEVLGYSQTDMDMLVRRAETRLQKLKSAPPPPPPQRQKSVPTPVKSSTPQTRFKPTAPPASVSPPPSPVVRRREAAAEPAEAPPAAPEEVAPPVSEEERFASAVQKCMKARSESAHPCEYCMGMGSGDMNVWGCRMLGMDWTPGSGWLRIGQFRDDDTFVLDRRALRDIVREALAKVHSCPHLQYEYMEAVLECLPRAASVWGHWKYRACGQADEGAVQVKARSYVHGVELSASKTVQGLDPVGIADAIKVVRKALRLRRDVSLDLTLLKRDWQARN